MDKEIVPVTTDDQIDQLVALSNMIFREYYSGLLSDEQIDYMVGNFQSRTALLDQIRNDGIAYFFITDEEKPVGYFAVRPEKNRLFLNKIYIHKDYRGKGLGSRAFAFIETFAQKSNLSSIYLSVHRHNTISINIYFKRGFLVIDEQVKPIGNGFVMDDYVLEKKLSS